MSRSSPSTFENRLARESSPYLLQHAHNPVDWYPWGEEAFAAAREQDKPIFLSVGYSTCYWCHVMERESFEDDSIAALMNEHFINIKVDREERPDVDEIYMTAVQLITRQGGWPMSVFLEPRELKPIVGGTYFPPEDRGGMPGFPSVLRQIADAWQNQRETVETQADQIAAGITQVLSEQPEMVGLDDRHVDGAVALLMRSYDTTHGGFDGAPKFPMPANLDLLIEAAWDREDVRRAVLHTLDRMATGGMYDQVGGGFHRYSVDARWLVPHFEKMLYDNAQLAVTYARAIERTGDAFHERVLRQTLEYVQREMTHERGGFFSAQDAEVNAREGLNYLWTAEEVRAVLDDAGLGNEIDMAMEVFGLSHGTNFQDPHHPEDDPKNVLFLLDRAEALASSRGESVEQFFTRLDRIRAALFQARQKREAPRLDDKILAGWNGLMIAGFAEAGRVLSEPAYIQTAERAARFILDEMRDEAGGLRRSWRDGAAGVDGLLEDHAFFIRGLLALHRTSDDANWLDHAAQLAETAEKRFADQRGGYFDTIDGRSDLFVRPKSHYDGAVPSGNAVMLLNLIDLAERTGEQRWVEEAQHALVVVSGLLEHRPTGVVVSALALYRALDRVPAAVPSSSAGADGDEYAPVTARIEPARVSLEEGASATVTVHLDIARGIHINAHDPGVEGLAPLHIESGSSGVTLDVDYPAGARMRSSVSETPLRVHSEHVAIPVTMRRTGKVGSTIDLVITCQPCTEAACYEPRSIVAKAAVK